MKYLYSVNTWLAFKIAEHFYSNTHYVWCSPSYNAKGLNPPSSDPFEICNSLIKDIEGNDKHSSKISSNKIGIINGADNQLKNGIITNDQRLEIIDIVNIAEIDHFRPLIYVISYPDVSGLTKPASTKLTAGLFSKEYIIDKLPRDKFDIIDVLKNNRYV
jgi:hypothetical protein